MTTRAKALFALLLLVPLAAWAQLEVTELVGFGAGGDPVVQLSISGSTNDYNICTAVQATGVDPATVAAGEVIVTIADSVIVGSTSTSTPAMQTGDCGSSWASTTDWTITIVVAAGDSARIQGAGGNGGRGILFLDAFFNVYYTSGGGGGAGTVVGSGANALGSDGTATAGGAGGSGTALGGAPTSAEAGFPGGPALEATDGGPDVTLAPEAGATLEVWGGGGGGGGNGVSGSSPPAAGDGGDPGADGDAAVSGAAGGANGLAYSEPGSASIIEGGAGTIDDLGT